MLLCSIFSSFSLLVLIAWMGGFSCFWFNRLMGVGVVWSGCWKNCLFFPLRSSFSVSMVGLRCVILDFMEFTSFPSLL